MPKVKTEKDNSIISSAEPRKSSKPKTSTTSLSDDIIGSNIAKDKVKATAAESTEKRFTVAIHSTKNVIWEGVGKVEKGYNIVSKAEAEKWLTRNHVRLATPEEVAREYGA